ncbi:MAG: polysaccharide pyruvyl transferase CsaB [Andreesenia angusta]|nr:polysaccharide pyruvyl transferase CsaB [Andreesenia angusta]
MSKVVISGYYGFNNMGDESILTAIITDLRKNIPDIDITVLSENPEITEKNHNIKAVYRKNIFKIIKSIRKSDLLISGGGSLLQDVTSKRNVLYYLFIMYIGIIMKKKVMIYSQGMGPIRSEFNKKLTKRVLEKIDIITLRDSRSERFLKEIELKNPNVFVTADPVLALSQENLDIGKSILIGENLDFGARKNIGFVIRGKAKSKEFIEKLTKLSDRLVLEGGLNVVFIPFHHGQDLGILREIEANTREKVICLHDEYSIPELLSIIGNMDLIVGERLHSLIFSSVMKVPIIALSYDPKINNYLGYISEKVFSDIDEINFDKLYKEILYKLKRENEEEDELSERIDYLRAKLSRNTNEIKKLLE